jgi:hypothetical protein
MKYIIALLTCCCFSCASLNWSTQDTVMQTSLGVLIAADIAQTQHAIIDCYGTNKLCGYEMNPILGKHPSSEALFTYNITAFILHLGVSMALPSKYRTIWQSLWLGAEAATVTSNYGNGARVFPGWKF